MKPGDPQALDSETPIPPRVQLLEDRRLSQEKLSWQTIVIFFAVQAALLTVLLDSGRSRASLMGTAAIGFVISLVVTHLYLRVRYFELLHGKIVNPYLGTGEADLYAKAFEAGDKPWFLRVRVVHWFATQLKTHLVFSLLLLGSIIVNAALFVAFAQGWTPNS